MIGMPKLPKFSTLVMINPGKKYDITYDVVDSYFIAKAGVEGLL